MEQNLTLGLKEAVEYVFDHVKKSVNVRDTLLVSPTGRLYTRERLYELADEALIDPIEGHTLASLCEYLIGSASEIDQHITIHIVSPTEVRVFSKPRPSDQKRQCYFVAKAMLPYFKYDYWYPQEEFVLKLRTSFATSENIDEVLFAASHLVSTNEEAYVDDGVTQQATIRTGVATKKLANLPKSPMLCPYRTFMEINQPGSPFIFRTKNSDNGPLLKLEEADGGAWRLEAIHWIEEYLFAELNTARAKSALINHNITILA